MLRCVCGIFFTLIFFSCGSNSDVLSNAKMEKVLWDVAQGSEFLNGYIYTKHPEQNKAALNDAMLERICKVHKIKKKEFYNTMEYYRRRPNDLKEVLDTIVARQNKLAGKTTDSASTMFR